MQQRNLKLSVFSIFWFALGVLWIAIAIKDSSLASGLLASGFLCMGVYSLAISTSKVLNAPLNAPIDEVKPPRGFTLIRNAGLSLALVGVVLNFYSAWQI